MSGSLYRPIIMDELYVGCQLICLFLGSTRRVKCVSYPVTKVYGTTSTVDIANEIGCDGNWNMYALNNYSDNLAFLPMDRLTDKELFIYRMSGKLP